MADYVNAVARYWAKQKGMVVGEGWVGEDEVWLCDRKWNGIDVFGDQGEGVLKHLTLRADVVCGNQMLSQ